MACFTCRCVVHPEHTMWGFMVMITLKKSIRKVKSTLILNIVTITVSPHVVYSGCCYMNTNKGMLQQMHRESELTCRDVCGGLYYTISVLNIQHYYSQPVFLKYFLT